MDKHIKIIDSCENEGVKFDIIEYQNLKGIKNPEIAKNLFYAQKSGMKLRQVRATLLDESNSEIIAEAGALHYYKGKIKMENKVGGLGGLAKRMFGNKVNNEEIFRPSYIGKGEVYLEPSFSHFAIVNMNEGDILMDEGMFYCASKGLDIDVKMIKSISSKVLGDDGWFLTRVRGTGVLVVRLPVPEDELNIIHLDDEELKVDGNFALMFDSSLDFKVTKSTSSLIRGSLSGEGWLETFYGTGNVFLAPTMDIYEDIRGNNHSN